MNASKPFEHPPSRGKKGNKLKFSKVTHHAEKRNIEIPRSMVVEALSW